MLNWIYNWLYAAEIRHQQQMAVTADNHRLLIDINRGVHRIMTAQTDVAAQVVALTGQVQKILTEVTTASDILRARIASLEEQLANASTDAIPALEAAVADLKTALQGLDDVNPDAPTG